MCVRACKSVIVVGMPSGLIIQLQNFTVGN